MSLCGSNKFQINRNTTNTFVFTIKANGTTLPIVIDPSDTFEALLCSLSDGSVALAKAMTVSDAPSGKVMLELSAAEVAGLVSSRGAPEDRYYVKPNYSLVLNCNTVANGQFTARVEYVYVN